MLSRAVNQKAGNQEFSGGYATSRRFKWAGEISKISDQEKGTNT
jgi:hypothetical protein